jgi:chromosome segregation ATPase
MVMNSDLHDELERLNSDLAEAEDESIRLTARISGLRAQRDALAAALAAARPSDAGTEEPLRLDAIKKRTEAIETLLRHAGTPMSIDEVKDALNESWHDTSEYPVVASTLNLLHRTGRISKVARGRYVAA